MFSQQLSRAELIELCRVLRHNLAAGLTLRQVCTQLAGRGSPRIRALGKRILASIEKGDSFEAALAGEQQTLPQLFRALAVVGEETGHLPEVLADLEKFFILQQTLVRQAVAQSLAPLIQLGVAFLVIALLIVVLGVIAQTRGGTGAPSILGQTGVAGGVLFLLLSFGSFVLLFLLYRYLKPLRQKLGFDAFLLRVPGVGPCLESLILGRFCLALHLTLDTPMPIAKALRLSLEVTGNPRLLARADAIAKTLRSRQSLAAALEKCGVFPVDFLAVVETAEEAGRVPEAMRHQADRYYEEATFRLKALTTVLTFLIWLCYAIFMIIAIFYLAGIYLNALGG